MSRQYKEFKIGDLFDVYVGKRVVKKDWEEGDIPYVTASKKNNGIDGYIGNPIFTVSNLLTINFFGNTFYHPYEISIKDGTWGYKLKEKYKETEAIYFYMAAVINRKFEGKGTYDNALNSEIISSGKIYLPITPQGGPDWQYMEDFMKELESESQQIIETLDNISTITSVGVSSYPKPYGYKEFMLSDYFDINYGEHIKQNKRGGVPYITTSAFNNGVGGFVEGEPMYEGGCITVASDGSIGATFYQEGPFSASNITVVLEPKTGFLTQYIAQYLATKIRNYANKKFNYGHKYSVNRVRATSLKLPITPQGDPDWQYMEDFMRNIEQESEEVINKIQNIL